MSVKPKKHLGQHFLNDETVCQRMAALLENQADFQKVIEVGPGMGALTKYLLQSDKEIHVVEIDEESVDYLYENYPELRKNIHSRDFLREDLSAMMGNQPFAVFGNFPYNISSQILFKVLDFKDEIPLVVGMFQKEVAERIASPPGSKKYGIISVLLQAFYDIEYLFTVDEDVFTPPPKVKSGVIQLVRNQTKSLKCDHGKFKTVVKTAFNQRRKTLRNSLKSLTPKDFEASKEFNELLQKRPEQLSVSEFIWITEQIMV